MFDFFLVHWVVFALLFSFIVICMIVLSVISERKRLERLDARRKEALSNEVASDAASIEN